ncbi:uncharacterized protein [Fopius arisanus]|uniref:PEX13_1 protein n=1 Tax=Fopius arisanus TaxID=64838 RepID=A0A0C9Q5H9_9HYME|nr:PREDICTED: uncharacterized protein LOC105268781 [Fopius arisanus]
MNALLIFTILALASPIFGEEAIEQKNQQKRGVVPVGYGGQYLGGYNTLNYGYNGLSHGYLNNPYYYGHSAHAPAPLATSPLLLGHGYNHGYNNAYQAPLYTAPAARLPYAGLGHNLGYYNSW